MVDDVWFGLHTAPEGFDFDYMSHMAREAEKARLDIFTITDHFMNMANPNGQQGHPLECWTTLAGLASLTNRIRLGPLVACYAYREPTVLAKMATTVDIISKGRLVMGIGAGWHEAEFKGYLGGFPSAGSRLTGLEETVKICKSMLCNDRTSFHGKMYKIDDVLNSPQPIQKPVPIMIGGGGEQRTLRIVARYADISHFVSTGQDFEGLLRKVELLKKYCSSENRDFENIRMGTWYFACLGETEGKAESKMRSLEGGLGVPAGSLLKTYAGSVGTPDMVAAGVQRLVDSGFRLITFIGVFTDDDVRLLSDELIPKIKI